MKLSNYFLFVMTICFIFVSGCSLFDSGSGSKYSNSGTTPLCEEGQTLTTVGGTQTCVNNDLLDSTCTKDSDCGSSEYCNKDATPYVCTAEPCMLDSDCPQNDPIWGAMVCNKTSVPNRCVDANGDGCVVITTNGQTTSNCGIAQYCDNTHGHPYACKAQPCTGDAVCQKCDSGMTCNTVGGYKINTRPNNSTYEYVCNLAPYVHICKVQELTPPPSGGCTTDADCTASALGQKCLAGTAPRKCGCNAPSDCTNCTSGHFCRVSTHACQTPPTNECTVGTGPRNAATCTAGQQFQTWDDCDDIYFGCDQYFCNDFVDTEYRKCQIRVYATGPGSSVCTKQYQCFSGWCFYAPNQNPTA
ncbi:MAG: hypothetical protein NTY22_02390, partial [Proteobacteria bacterium]|nr:hypothetical protein [Pseudomonadota bacterium]